MSQCTGTTYFLLDKKYYLYHATIQGIRFFRLRIACDKNNGKWLASKHNYTELGVWQHFVRDRLLICDA